MAELRGQGGVAARALEFLILTACRVGEVVNAGWEEFNLPEKIWVVPPGRMKAGKEHRIPLSDAAMVVIEQMAAIRSGGHVFPGISHVQPLSTSALPRLLMRMGRTDLTSHGFRSTFRDWAAECTNFPREVAEQALAHSIGNATETAYRRGDLFRKRRQLMDAWARYCAAPATAGDGEVVAIGGRRR
jgi:integrase